MNAYSGPPITIGNVTADHVRANRRRDIEAELVREIARSYKVSQSTISRLTA